MRAVLVVLALAAGVRAADPPPPAEVVAGKVSWRSVGPPNMGGRVTALAVVESDPTTFYVGTGTGGLLKTTNNGTTFTNVFDKQATVAIGDVAVCPSQPNIVWVGTGENNPRNSVSYGDGVYKSTDGGKTWANVGLTKTFQIGKIVTHPTNPDIVYVGALGRLYGPNPERGVFKTEDGGKSWTKSLFINDQTGIIDMRIDPFDPNTVIAAAWEHRRDEFDSFQGEADTWPTRDQYGPAVNHAPGSGLYKTTDGGKTWNKLTNGLPSTKMGRIGLDFSHKTKGLVMAIIDTEKSGSGQAAGLGITGSDLPKEGGAKVDTVAKGGPAETAGLKAGDQIIKADSTKITSLGTLTEYILENKPPQSKLSLVLLREGKETKIDVTLGVRKPPAPAAQRIILGVTFKMGSMTIDRVTPNSSAAQAGIESGDTITQIGDKAIAKNEEYQAAMANAKAGDKVMVTVLRGEEKKVIEVTLRPGAGGPRRDPTAEPSDRPFSTTLGGQRANVQLAQGPDGFQNGGVFLSKDAGETWTRINSLNPRPMYFAQIRIDPKDDAKVYVLGVRMAYSVDGGKTFKGGKDSGTHADQHALWIDPRDGRHMILGNDGGPYLTYDNGDHWEHLNHLALGQFYHVAVDNRMPYRIYGGLQDNGSWGGPSRTARGFGPTAADWYNVGGGDGFVCRVDPTDPNVVYYESQNGNMVRRNLKTGESGVFPGRDLRTSLKLRFNWNTPFILSNHNPAIVYAGAQMVLKSIERGNRMKAISPELTRTPVGTLIAIAESPSNPDILWAGTDDGYLWLTTNGGTTWTNLTKNIPGLPGPRWVSTIETSRAKEGRCYVVFDAHRSNDDRPYVYVTEDLGKTWKSLSDKLPPFGSTRVLREDIVNPSLLYLGTEFGAYASVDAGAQWFKLGANLPTVPVHEFAQPDPKIAPELVAGTHGRSIWIADVTSLRQVTPEMAKAPATLFTPSPVIRYRRVPTSRSPESSADRAFVGENPPDGTQIDYILGAKSEKVTLQISDILGKVIWQADSKPQAKDAGLHQIRWPGTISVANIIRLAPPGEYRVTLTVDGKEYTKKVVVEAERTAE